MPLLSFSMAKIILSVATGLILLVSCKSPNQRSETKEVVVGPDGKIVRKCDFSTLDVDRVFDFMKNKAEGFTARVSGDDRRKNISYMTMFSFEYLYCATAKLIPMKKKSLPIQLIFDQLEKAKLMPPLAAKLINLMSAEKNNVKFKHTGENKARITIDLATDAINSISRRRQIGNELKKVPIGSGVSAIHFKTLKRGYFPDDKTFSFSRTVPKELLAHPNNTGFARSRSTKKTTIITYALGGFAEAFSWLAGGTFSLLFAIDDKIEIDIEVSSKSETMEASVVDIKGIKGLRLFGISKNTNSGGNILSSLDKVRYKRMQIGVAKEHENGSSVEFHASLQTYLNLSSFFDKRGRIRASRDELMFEDAIIPALVGGAVINSAAIAYDYFTKNLGSRYNSRDSNEYAFRKTYGLSRAAQKKYEKKYNFLANGSTHANDPEAGDLERTQITNLIYYTSADLFGSGRHADDVRNILIKTLDELNRNSSSQNADDPAQLDAVIDFSSDVWNIGIVAKRAYTWDVKMVPQKIDASGYFKFLGKLRKP